MTSRILLAASLLLPMSTVFAADPLMRIESRDGRIFMMRGDRTILQYNMEPTADAAKNEPHFTRSGYIHPLYSPSGKTVTGDYSPDHKHQHGLFFAWTKTGFEGRDPEFWNQAQEKGRVSFQRRIPDSVFHGETECGFTVEHLWEDLKAPGGPKPVLTETWTVTAHDAGDEVFAFEIEATQHMKGEKPLRVKKYHYGGMAIRGSNEWVAESKEATPPAAMLTSEGLNRGNGNHSRPRWVAMTGPVDGEKAGFAVIGDERNFRAPQWVRLHPSMPYFVFAPMVEEPFTIEPGTPYVSRFRYLVFDGEADSEKIENWEKRVWGGE